MKKILVAILAVLYLATSTGATIHLHYCMGKLTSWGLLHSKDKDDCSVCGMTKKKGCCEDKHQTLKIDQQYNFTSASISIPKIANLVSSHYMVEPSFTIRSTEIIFSSSSNSPPGKTKIPLFIRNSVYRI